MVGEIDSQEIVLTLFPSADVVRLKELQRIRKTFIPELAMRLTRQLIDARIYVPNAITMVTQLANLVADGKDKLHLDFVYGGNNRIAEYLLLVREAILVGMENGSSDPLLPAL